MANVLVRNVPDEVIEELKHLAKLHNHPLQQELRQILVSSARQPHADVAQRAGEIRRKLARKKREYSDSVELLREDRAR
jgi:plasmid stability protein